MYFMDVKSYAGQPPLCYCSPSCWKTRIKSDIRLSTSFPPTKNCRSFVWPPFVNQQPPTSQQPPTMVHRRHQPSLAEYFLISFVSSYYSSSQDTIHQLQHYSPTKHHSPAKIYDELFDKFTNKALTSFYGKTVFMRHYSSDYETTIFWIFLISMVSR